MGSRLFSILNQLRLLKNVKNSYQLCETRSLSSIDSTNKTSLYSKISTIGHPSKSLVPELEKSVESANEARFAQLQKRGRNAQERYAQAFELQNMIQGLRKRKRYAQALKVSEWMVSKSVCESRPGYHAVRLDLIGRVRGLDSAESYFNNLSDELKTDRTYGVLLMCYVRECLVDKSLSQFNKMKEMGFAISFNYNNIMCLYTRIGEHEKVLDVLTEMKEDGISPNNFSYRFCINSYGARSDINGIEKLLHEMEEQTHISMDWNTYAMVANFYIKAGLTDKAIETLKKVEEKLEKKDRVGYNHLISLYTSLGNKAEALRLWEKKKTLCKRFKSKDYSTMLGSLVKLRDLEEAEKLLKEWESSGNAYDFRMPNILLIGYSFNGMIEKAEEMLNDIIEKGKTPIPDSWGIVSAGYLKKGEMEKATESMKKALKLLEGNEGWRPNAEVITGILNWLCDNADVDNVAHFVESLSNVIPMNREMYHALIKANIRGGGEVDQLVKKMKADQIEEDEETKKILSFRQAEA